MAMLSWRQRRLSSSSRHQSWLMVRAASLLLVVVLLLLLCSSTAARVPTKTAITTTSTQQQQQQQQQEEKDDAALLTLPLIPHHVQKKRRRRRRLDNTSSNSHNNNNNNNNNSDGILEQEEEEESTRRPRRHTAKTPATTTTTALQVGALYQGYGTHYVDLWVGTPPQRQTVIVDTGSGVTAFPCSGCKDCGDSYHIDRYFVEDDSKTFHKFDCNECKRGVCKSSRNAANKNNSGECRIGMSYQEGSSWSAYECSDTTYTGGPHSRPLLQQQDRDSSSTTATKQQGDDLNPEHAKDFSFELTFGCQTRITGLFKTQLADGIMGMDNADTAFWKQMHKAKAIPSPNFCLCFSRQPTAERDGTEAGALTLGGMDDRFHTSPMVYTKHESFRGGFFAVHVRKMYLREGGAGESAGASNKNANVVQINVDETQLNRGNVIVDSGTTDTYFTRNLSGPFKAAYKQMTGKDYSHSAVALTKEQLDAMPTILVQIAGDLDYNKELYPHPKTVIGFAGYHDVDGDFPYDVILAIPPSHYMEYDDKQKKYVARFYTDEGSGSVLGANSMMGHNIYFDVDHSRIGWAESPCDYTHLVRDSGYKFGDENDELPEAPAATSEKKTTPPDDDDVNVDNDDVVEDVEPSEPTVTIPPVAEDVQQQQQQQQEDVEDTHEQDEHKVDKPDTSTKPPYSIHPAVDACDDWSCRGSVLGTLLVVLVVGMVVGRAIAGRVRRTGGVRYHGAAEMVDISSANEEDDEGQFSPRYRDHPEPVAVAAAAAAEEGTGYEEEDEEEGEFEGRKIA